MKHKLLMMLALLVCTTMAWAQFSGGSGSAESPYLISSETDWNTFASNVNGGTTYGSNYFKLTNNISVSTMVGVSGHTFNGTFDGDGKTLTVNYNVTNSQETSTSTAAPFAFVDGVTIKNLHIAGSIATVGMRPASVIGFANGDCTITNCWSEVAISSSYNKDIDAGGFVARVNENKSVTLINCLFSGSITYSNANGYEGGGMVGWTQDNATATLNNCYFAPSSISFTKSSDLKVYTFVGGKRDNVNLNTCYYNSVAASETKLTAEGSDASVMNNDELLAALGSGWEIRNNEVVPVMNAYTLSGNGTEQSPYLIETANDWNHLASNVFLGNTYSGKYFQLSDNISVSRMIGTSNSEFSGTFDGNGKTLTFTATAAAGPTAPFRFVNGATIKDLVIDGSITTSYKNAASLIGRSRGNTAITNCVSTVAINSNFEGDGTHGGFVGYITEGTTSIEGCIFNGKLLGEDTHSWGGFVGWVSEGAQGNITNCIFNPTGVSQNRDNSQTFIRHSGENYTVTNSYYRDILKFEQGRRYYSIEGSEHLRFEFADAPTNYYDVSGITSYPVGFKMNDVFYAGCKVTDSYDTGDEVSVNLILEDGYSCSGFQVVSATNSPVGDYEFNNVITGSKNPYTLRTYYRDNIRFEPTGLIIMNFAGNGSEGDPYLIEYPVQWERLRSMSTAETAGKYFKLMIDLDNVTTMVDTEFAGTFDGNGHTITIAYGSADSYLGTEYEYEYVAPFLYAKGAVIKNLHVAGDIYTNRKYAAGIIGKSTVDAAHPNTITNCRSSVTIHSNYVGWGYHGGFVACIEGVPSEQEDGELNITGCLFDGSFIYSGTEACGGFLGIYEHYWKQSINIQDCLFKPAAIDLSNGSTDHSTFIYSSKITTSIQRSYYTQAFGEEQGTKAYVLTAQPANLGEAGTAYNVSGITAYANGLGQDGKYYIGTIGLYNNQSNADLISDIATNYSSENVNVTLQGRTFCKDGKWNTLCLPFDVVNLTGTPLQGATLMELGNSDACNTGFDASSSTLNLEFVAADGIEAGHAYIVKWTSGSDIENPVFNGVRVENEDPNNQEVISKDGKVSFRGTYDFTTYADADNTILFLGGNNTLYYPQNDASIGAFRAYFQLNGITAADINPNNVKMFFGDEVETGIIDARGKKEDGRGDGVIYNIAGQRLNKPQRGINIVNGKKIVIK